MEPKTERLGETRFMNCGLKATVIEYRRYDDIDVKFETGEIRYNTSYAHFINGRISPIKKVCADQSRVGESHLMSNGQNATIIEYRSSSDIDIKFDDGTIRKNASYKHFINGKISPEHRIKCDRSRVGESKMMNNGLVATIIEYRKHDDMDIRFEDDVIVRSVRYDHFKEGVIAHHKIKSNTSTSIQEFAVFYYLRNCGFRKIERGEWKDNGFGRFELDLYHEATNIAIEIDGGWHSKEAPAERELRKNQTCKELGIKLYRLRDPSLPQMQNDYSTNFILDKSKTISVGLIDCEKELTTILSENRIEFDFETIDFVRDREDILREYYEQYHDKYRQEKVGQTNYSKSAKQKMIIVEYRSYKDVDVKFEDGTIRTHVTYQHFKNGSVDAINIKNETKAIDILGKQRLMNNGLIATVIACRTHKDIDVKFEDGTVRYNVSYHAFKRGCIGSRANND